MDIDQVIMMGVGRLLIPRASISEIMTLEDTCVFEQLDCTIDGCDRNVRIPRRRATVKLLSVWMVIRFGEHACNDATLIGHAEAFLRAKLFNATQETALVRAASL